MTEHCRDLRNYAGRQRLLGINLSECVQGVYALLQTDTCAVDQTDDRRSHLTCQLVQTYNLLRMHLTQGSVQYGSVLTVHIDKITVNQTIAGNYSVRRALRLLQIKISASGSHLSADFHKTVPVQQTFNSSACRALCCITHFQPSIYLFDALYKVALIQNDIGINFNKNWAENQGEICHKISFFA